MIDMNEYDKKTGLTEMQLAEFDEAYNLQKRELNVAYVFLIFLGWAGLHKFYLGKIGMAIAYFLTFGFFFMGLVYDFFTIKNQVEEYNNVLATEIMTEILNS